MAMAFEKPGAGGQARIDENIGAKSPAQRVPGRASSQKLVGGGAAIAIHGRVSRLGAGC